jgi:hypothetical protein
MTKYRDMIIILTKILPIKAIKVNDNGPCKKGGGIQIPTEADLTTSRSKIKKKSIIIEMIGIIH